MGYQRSRQQVRQRVVRDAHRQGDTGTVSFTTLNEFIADAYDEWWYFLGDSDRSALGRSHRSLSIASDSPTLDLPSEFQGLTGWRVLDAAGNVDSLPPALVRQETALANGWLDADAQEPDFPDRRRRYYLEGPGQQFDTDLQQLVTFGLRLRAFPGFTAGETVTITYKTTAPSLGDPTDVDTGDDLQPIEFISPPNYRNLCALVRARAATRGDDTEVRRALQELQASTIATVEALTREDRSGTLTADDFRDLSRGTSGYA